VPFWFLFLTACGATDPSGPETEPTANNYPETATVNHTDEFHGVTVADPWRWLEDDVRENTAVRDWVEAQNAVTFGYLREIPEREAINE
jgi:prolyl oligopeptidase